MWEVALKMTADKLRLSLDQAPGNKLGSPTMMAAILYPALPCASKLRHPP
jgi:hypothetical protein